MKKVMPIINTLTSVTMVFFLVFTAIRFLLSSLFLAIEYRMPGFPPDPYGFSRDDRLKWANISVAYLNTNADSTFLETQRLNENQPLFNEREIKHMIDVKFLVQRLIVSWSVTMALLILFGLFSKEYKFFPEYWQAFSRGGLWAISLVAIILFGVVLSFDQLFTGFHRIFFKGDTWLFNYSDTLIRLFPMRFWQDAFIFVGLITVIGGVVVFLIGRRLKKKFSMSEPPVKQTSP